MLRRKGPLFPSLNETLCPDHNTFSHTLVHGLFRPGLEGQRQQPRLSRLDARHACYIPQSAAVLAYLAGAWRQPSFDQRIPQISVFLRGWQAGRTGAYDVSSIYVVSRN